MVELTSRRCGRLGSPGGGDLSRDRAGHSDGDFEILADFDDRVSQRWVVPRGSVR